MKKYLCHFQNSFLCFVVALFFLLVFPAVSWAQGNFVSFSSATYSAKKTDGTATITVNFTRVFGNTGMITVFYQAGPGGTATPGVDYAPTAGQLTLPAGSPGSYSQTFTVQLINGGVQDGTTTLALALSTPMNATIGPPGNATLTISPGPSTTVAYLPGPAPVVGDIVTQCVNQYPTPQDRTTIGIGEQVNCSIASFQDTDIAVDQYGNQTTVQDSMGDVIWSVTGPGSVYPTVGSTTTLTADYIVAPAGAPLTIFADVNDSGKLGKDPPVKKKKDITVSSPSDTVVLSVTDKPDSAWKAGPPNNNLGARSVFLLQVLPTDVSFKDLGFVLKVAPKPVKWADGTVETWGGTETDGTLSDFGATPNLANWTIPTALIPVTRIQGKDTSIQLLPWTVSWVDPKSGQSFGFGFALNQILFEFQGSTNMTRISVTTTSPTTVTKTGGYMGPWQ